MFENLKITAKMRSPVCFSEYLRFDCILSAAKAKELLKSDFYTLGKQYSGTATVIKTLSAFLKFNASYGVFHASCAISDNEFVTAYSKRWNSAFDRTVKFKGKGKQEIDTARGFFKAYRNPLVYHVMPEIIFYAVGDKQEITRLLSENIRYLGKKSSQGYGEIASWTVETIEEDKSIFDGEKLMRVIPVSEQVKAIYSIAELAVIPPSYRKETQLCYIP